MRARNLLVVLFFLAAALLSVLPAEARGPNPSRVPFSSLRTLTFYDGRRTAARRTAAVDQLTCRGKPCRRFKPDAVQCSSLGDGEWKCQADLPASIRMGRVEVSCEGWGHADDPYVLKGSCGLEYTLLPAYDTSANSQRAYDSHQRSNDSDIPAGVFWLFFIGILVYIVYGFFKGNNGASTGNAAGSGGTRPGGGGGGGGGGGWGSGWGSGPGTGTDAPPAYTPQAKTEPGTANASNAQQQQQQAPGWRPGFWTGLGLGGLGGSLLNRNQGAGGQRWGYDDLRTRYDPRARYRSRFDEDYDEGYGRRGGFGGGGGGYGYGGAGGLAGPSHSSDSGSLRPSSGFGGTRHR